MALQQIFFQSLSNNKLNVEYAKYMSVLKNDINIDVNNIDNPTLKLLSKIMIYYMTNWPGWGAIKKNPKESNSGLAYINFRKYLKCHIQYVMENKSSLWKMAKQAKQLKSRYMQISNEDNNVNLPYCIQLKGNTNYISSVLFREQNNAIYTTHHFLKEWDMENITLQKFINYPYVAVNLSLPDLCLSRNNTTEIERYLRRNPERKHLPSKEFILYTNKIDASAPVEVYKYYFFKKYIQQFEAIVSSTDMISEFRKEEILTILSEFLKDVDEFDLFGKTMATNTAVCFNIGKCRYVRSKTKRSDGSMSNEKYVYYYENITPRVLLTLKRFHAEQDISGNTQIGDINGVSFVQLNNASLNIKEFVASINSEDCISYSCTLCNKVFSTYTNIQGHFQSLHKGECEVVCSKCFTSFTLQDLAEKRWFHTCTPRLTA